MRKLFPDLVRRIIIPYLLVATTWFAASHAVLEHLPLPLPGYLVEVLDDAAFGIFTSLLLYRLLATRERALKDAESRRRQADLIARAKTEELAAAAARQALELNTVFSAMPDGVLVYDADGTVVRANAAAFAFFGFDPLGRTAPEIAAESLLRWPGGSPADPDSLPSQLAARGRTVSEEVLIGSRHEGRELVATITSSPLITQGEVTGVVSVIHDVTERRKLLAQLAADHAELATILQQMPVGMILASAERAAAPRWNEQVERILGHPFAPGSAGGRRVWAEEPCPAGPPDDVIQELLEQALRTGEAIRDREIRFLREDGSCVTLMTSAVPIRDQEARITGALATLNDITARKQVEETLRRSNIELKSLSVQLGNSLTAQKKIEDDLRRSNMELERAREELERLYRNAKRVAALDERQRLARELHDSVSQALYGMALGTQAALEMVGPNDGKLAKTLNYVLAQAASAVSDMRALIYELRPELVEKVGLVTALRKQADSLQVTASLDIQANLCPEPDIDLSVKDGLYRIAHHALQNIVQHAQATQAELRLECDESAVTLTVEDNGGGFDPDKVPPDHLGVASMRERATRLNGTISIESRPGIGTKITVRVPLVAGRAA